MSTEPSARVLAGLDSVHMESVLPIAIDANGGDKSPADIVAGARRARDELGVESSSSARPTSPTSPATCR